MARDSTPPESDRMRHWRDQLDRANCSKTLREVATEHPFSASKAPVQAVLAFHVFQEPGSTADTTLASLVN
ncbi:hypothetical protein P171DRAFT_437705 [Karstenula rhodostoma CBS 690.94]|uniref:Uncharacterized protein n=1 Tax=Karstenula rhodostoma CBS 690.94 TaxID=1392251 RepID=A0A9P4P3K2_9PLEO|nr:hypothetical protein P171DRAFT_437705 [Karstenula rhodostoma CBS 690.94]